MTIKQISLETIAFDLSPTVRAEVNEETVGEYAETYRARKPMPPPRVFVDKAGVVRLADGTHRVKAALLAGVTQLRCEVETGGYAEALKFALCSNASHGLRRTNADKRACIGAALKEWPTLSNVQLATICAVGESTVRLVRGQLEENSQIPETAVRIGGDGKRYPASQKKTLKTKPLETKGTMSARMLPGGEVAYAEREPYPVVVTSPVVPVTVPPMVAQRIMELYREALRLPYSDPAFRHFMTGMIALKQEIQMPLPGIMEQVPSQPSKAKASCKELEDYCVSVGMPASDGAAFYDRCLASGWKNGGRPIKDIFAMVRSWKAQGYLASQKQGQRNGPMNGAPKPKHYATLEAEQELARIKKEDAEFELRRGAR